MRLVENQLAPDFAVTDAISKRVLKLGDLYGFPSLISFHRYAACPFCNLHVHELCKAFPRLDQHGLKVVAIFSSLPDRLAEQFETRSVPFPIAADPSLDAYRDFGIERSTLGMLTSFVHPRGIVATAKGFFPGKIDGDVRWLPADFLLRPDGTIARTFYSTNITQHLPLSIVEQFAKQHGNA